MGKKPIKKLAVKREKLHSLTREALGKVGGGLKISTVDTILCSDDCKSNSITSRGMNHNQALLLVG